LSADTGAAGRCRGTLRETERAQHTMCLRRKIKSARFARSTGGETRGGACSAFCDRWRGNHRNRDSGGEVFERDKPSARLRANSVGIKRRGRRTTRGMASGASGEKSTERKHRHTAREAGPKETPQEILGRRRRLREEPRKRQREQRYERKREYPCGTLRENSKTRERRRV
jgi:hypothetical protein